MIKRAVLLYLGLACVIPLQGHGANPIDIQEQLDRARASQEAREARLGEERIQWQHISSNTDGKTTKTCIRTYECFTVFLYYADTVS